jgi:aldehyde dehydrogenase (NAD+)
MNWNNLPSINRTAMDPIQIREIFNLQLGNRNVVAQSSPAERIAKLRRLQNFLLDHVDEACEATRLDFQKPIAETIIGELLVLQSELSYAIRHLHRWVRPSRKATPLTSLGTSSYIQYEAKGCSLIIAPWNYPINLAFKPLISAIAAGCTAIIKPSELTPNASAFVRKVVESVFQSEEVAVIEGDAATAQTLIELPFHHIFFTGSPAVGKIVMKAAAENLASVTLELGGKSPSIVDETADIPATARRIAWAKFFNNGQTCIAPDYVLLHESVYDRFVAEMGKVIDGMYNEDNNGIEHSASYGRIVNDRHFDRLVGNLQDAVANGAKIERGGGTQPAQRFIEPTLISNVTDTMKLMTDEIFGPILPLKKFTHLTDAVAFVNGLDKPLALYIHSNSAKNADYVLNNTSAGNALVNELLTQFGNPEIPFGGVNNSGLGKSNGFYGFQEFSNAKGVTRRRFGTLRFLYPPYSDQFLKVLKKALRWV